MQQAFRTCQLSTASKSYNIVFLTSLQSPMATKRAGVAPHARVLLPYSIALCIVSDAIVDCLSQTGGVFYQTQVDVASASGVAGT